MDKFVLRVPKWQGELLFTKELLVFVGIIVLMLAGFLLCFWGYKYFKTALFLGIGGAACYVSFLLVEPVTDNSVFRLFLTALLTFLGVCILRFLDIIWGCFLDKLRIRDTPGRHIYLVAAPLGAAMIGLTIYWFIWRGRIETAVTAAVCCVGGLLFQRFRKGKVVRFQCYNDLLRFPRPEADESGLGYIVMESEEPILPEPEPIPEPAAVIVPEPEPISEPAAVIVPEPEPIPEPEVVITPEPEPESELLEDALFVRQMNEHSKERHAGAASRKKRRSHRRLDSKLAKGAAIAAAGLGLFFVGRASKGRD